MTLKELFAGRNFDLQAAQDRMTELMREEGLPYGARTMTFNSRKAQELAAWAETQPGAGRIHDALFRAYFVDGRNIAEVETLLSVVEGLGLSVEAAREVLETRSFRDVVDRDWDRSRQLGITGVPTFVAGNRGGVGAQPYDVLEKLIVGAGATRRSVSDSNELTNTE